MTKKFPLDKDVPRRYIAALLILLPLFWVFALYWEPLVPSILYPIILVPLTVTTLWLAFVFACARRQAMAAACLASIAGLAYLCFPILEERASPKQVIVDAKNCKVTIRGKFKLGLTRQVLEGLRTKDPEGRVGTVLFDYSNGGTSIEAERMSNLLPRAGVKRSVALGTCESACAVAWSYFDEPLYNKHKPPLFHWSSFGDGGLPLPKGLSCALNPRTCWQRPRDFWMDAFGSPDLHRGKLDLLSPTPVGHDNESLYRKSWC